MLSRFPTPRLITLAWLLLVGLSAVASAHPMGTFTIAHYSAIRIEPDAVHLRYRIDFAEVPAVEQMSALDRDGDREISATEQAAYLQGLVKQLTQGLSLRLDGQPVALSVMSSDVVKSEGEGGLPTLLVTVDYRVPLNGVAGRHTLDYFEDNFSRTQGWREIVAFTPPGSERCRIVQSSVPAVDASRELTAYPKDSLTRPTEETNAHVVFVIDDNARSASPTTQAASAPSELAPPAPRQLDRFAQLIKAHDLSFGVWVFALAAAFMLGSFHALSPGHGKTIVAAYLVGSRGTPWHAVFLGALVTITHTAGVFVLGLVVLLGSRYVSSERIYPWAELISGLAVLCIGSWQLVRRWSALHAADAPPQDEDHEHTWTGAHVTRRGDGQVSTRAGLIGLGISGGLVPCPSALVVLLSAIALHRVAMGLMLIVTFSLGLASVLVLIGLLVLRAQRFVEASGWPGAWARRLPLMSSALVVVLGLVLVLKAYPTIH